MKVSKEQMAENRERILETAAQLFREKGFDGIGVADLMKSAGLTHGGFYGHFASKDDLMAQATERALGKLHTAWAALARDAAHNGQDPLGAVESAYLSARHRDAPGHGCLLPWARQGVLLLNAVLTVEEGRAGSHQGKGWEGFTDAIVQALDREKEGLVFMLWGAYAQAKGKLLQGRHCVLRAPHPSPLSAHRGFLGCGHFGKANRWLQGAGKAPVDWSLPPRAAVEALLAQEALATP